MCVADVSVIAEGQVNYHSTKRLPYGGADIDTLLLSLLKQQSQHCSNPQRLKETCARATAPASDTSEVQGDSALSNAIHCSKFCTMFPLTAS